MLRRFTDNARYTKLRGQIDFGNGDRLHGRLQLEIFQSRGFPFIIEKHTHVVDLLPIQIYKVWIPSGFQSYCSAKVGTNKIRFCREKRLRNVHDTSRRLGRTTARLFNNNVADFQSMQLERSPRKVSYGDSHVVVRFNRHNVRCTYAKGRNWSFGTFGISAPIATDELSNGIKQSLHSNFL